MVVKIQKLDWSDFSNKYGVSEIESCFSKQDFETLCSQHKKIRVIFNQQKRKEM
jgi:hypothetical protein